ncbi:DENN domain-containing protein 1A-like isoform X1 [Pieris brassicae]|uniref:UDENN domain-containing protein n=1 Tax=Pieris brassicae TaxID=7116 RepID=A0A9P0XJ76_PIEBR|nr:DENN domain-containing protein 1A-like isoform X1 [Pieris brassicae]CAH4038500.1 unnamed protein product [Pieris brassicae]
MGTRIRGSVRHLYELFCEVSPVKEPSIIQKYPESYDNEENMKHIPKFAFPCPLDKSYVQHYSFVLTSVDSKYTFGFCRYDPKANTTLLLLSHIPWHDIFYKLLNCIANLLNSPERGELKSFLEACRIRPPMPGDTLKVTYNASHSVFSCQCPDEKLPSIPENCNLTEFFSALDADCMIGLWAALLNERRIALVASKPSRLSACVQAANALLFPMSWQHIYIPIVPKFLVDYLLAPMPFLIGVPRSVFETVRMSDLGEIVIIDIDTNELRSPFNDSESLPHMLVVNLKKSLGDKNALGDAVSRAFLRALVCLIGGYRDAICIENEQFEFSSEAFIKTRKHMQQFLSKMLESQIFQQFIEERLDLINSGKGFNDEFEIECNFYYDKSSSSSGQKLKQQYKDWAKNVKKEGGAFFKTVKDKANPAMQSAVKTVRQGGKNVKSAVKGLKIKMPKSRSRPSSVTTTDDSRFSCGSVTPVSTSSDSSPTNVRSHEPPSTASLDLLTEMEFLLNRNDNFPSAVHSPEISLPDKSKTMLPQIPPRLPARPQTRHRYPIVSTKKLIDFSEAPMPPPRSIQPPKACFVSNITRNEPKQAEFRTSTFSFAEGTNKPKLQLTVKQTRPNCNGNAQTSAVQEKRPEAMRTGRVESCDSDVDLIKLDVSSPALEDFDPLRYRDKNDKIEKLNSTTDSALLHEYGLDFSQFSLNFTSSSSDQQSSSVSKGWTTFN